MKMGGDTDLVELKNILKVYNSLCFRNRDNPSYSRFSFISSIVRNRQIQGKFSSL